MDLKDTLINRRRELQEDVDSHLRIAREQQATEGRDIVDMSDIGVEEEMSFALLQMRTTTLASVDAALVRLVSGAYGVCVECGESIPLSRLRALPIAGRCRDCEAHREQGLNPSNRLYARDGGGTTLLPDVRSL